MKRTISVFLSMVMLLGFLPCMAFPTNAQDNTAEPEITFTRVAPTALTAGTYLICGVSAKATEDGDSAAFMTAKSDGKDRLYGTDLPVQGDSVTTAATDCMWELIDADGGFYIKSVSEGEYLYWNSDRGGNKIYKTQSVEEASVWSILALEKNVSNSETVTVYTLVQADGRGLSCNLFGSGEGYLGFAAYNYVNTSCMCSLEFYLAGYTGTSHDHAYEAVVTAPTCTEQGYTIYTCACGDSYSEIIAATGHSFENGACTECGAPEAALGDVNGDGKIDTTDAKLIMQFDLGLIGEEAIHMAAADVNGDGKIDTTDAKLIMQLDLGLITEFPKP